MRNRKWHHHRFRGWKRGKKKRGAESHRLRPRHGPERKKRGCVCAKQGCFWLSSRNTKPLGNKKCEDWMWRQPYCTSKATHREEERNGKEEERERERASQQQRTHPIQTKTLCGRKMKMEKRDREQMVSREINTKRWSKHEQMWRKKCWKWKRKFVIPACFINNQKELQKMVAKWNVWALS